MSYDFNNPRYWFDRAEEMRVRADVMTDPTNREIMLRIAADYERLGQRAFQQQPKNRNNVASAAMTVRSGVSKSNDWQESTRRFATLGGNKKS
jgi:hypothetical protein